MFSSGRSEELCVEFIWVQPNLICSKERLQGADLLLPLLCEAPEQNYSEKGMREEGWGGENSYTVPTLFLRPLSFCVTIRSTSSLYLFSQAFFYLSSPVGSFHSFLSVSPRSLYFSNYPSWLLLSLPSFLHFFPPYFFFPLAHEIHMFECPSPKALLFCQLFELVLACAI